MINKVNVERFEVDELREQKDTPITLKVNGETYREFKQIMSEQKLIPSTIINQFMKLTNNVLKSGEGGEVAFIFKSTKKEDNN